MFELILRLCIASAVAYGSREYGTPAFEWAFPITTAYGFYAIVCHALSRRWESLGSSLQAAGDAMALGVFAGAGGALNSFGFLAAIPVVYAIARRYAHPITASAAGLSMYVGFMLFAEGQPALDFHAKALAMTVAGCLVVPRAARNKRSTVELADAEATLPAPPEAVSSLPDPELDHLRAANEAMTARHRELEDQIRRDAAIKELIAFRGDSTNELAATLAHLTGAEAAVIYVRSESADDLVVQGSFGHWPTVLLDTAIPLIPGETAGNLRWALESQVSGLIDDGHHATALLSREDRIIGLVVVRTEDAADPGLAELCDALTTLVIEQTERRRIANRLKEAEIRYAVASVTQGATTATSLAERVVRELASLVRADGLCLFWTEDHESKLAACEGETFDVAPVLALKPGPGIDGWLAAGAPEIAAFRTMTDPYCNPGEAIQSRIGSFVMVPLQSGRHPFGFLLAATHRAGGLDTSDLLSLRTLGIEISRTLARLNQTAVEEGLVTPTEFHELTRLGGAIVYIEPLNSTATKGREAEAIRQFVHIVRGKLPASGIVCRRDQNDLLAFLSGHSHEQAVSWANEIQALASMISVGGRPLAVRTKVAYLPNRVISAA